MSVKKNQIAPTYTNPAFDNKITKTEHSGEGSPTGSNIFIVKHNNGKTSPSHADPFQHEPITQKNFCQSILRGIRCRQLKIFFYFDF